MIVLTQSYRDSGLTGLVPYTAWAFRVGTRCISTDPNGLNDAMPHALALLRERHPLVTHLLNFRLQHLEGGIIFLGTGDLYTTKENLDRILTRDKISDHA